MKKIALFIFIVTTYFNIPVYATGANIDFSKAYVDTNKSSVDEVTISGIKPLWTESFFSVDFALTPEYSLIPLGVLNQSSFQEQLEQALRNTKWVGEYLVNDKNYSTTLKIAVVQDGYVGGEIVHSELNVENGEYLHVRVTGDILSQFKMNGSFIDEDRISVETLENLPLDTPTRQLIRVKRVRALKFIDGDSSWNTNREYRMVLENGELSGTVGIPDKVYGSNDETSENGSIFLKLQDSGITALPIVDPKTELGVLAAHDKGDTIGIFGSKDDEGRLINVERIVLTSQHKTVEMTLNEDYLPQSLKFSDNSRLDLDNYTNEGATATYYDQKGNKVGQEILPLPMIQVNNAVDKLKQYINSPQPTQNNPLPTLSKEPILPTDSICTDVVNQFHNSMDNLVWAAFQLASIYSCAASAGTAVLTGGVAIPLAVWACSSVILNGMDKMVDAITKGNSPFRKANQINSVASTASSCITKKWVNCLQGLTPFAVNQGLKTAQSITLEICEQQQQNEKYCYGLQELCRSYGDELHSGLCFCWTHGYSESEGDKFIQACKALKGGEPNRVGGCDRKIGCTLQCSSDGEQPED